MKFFNTAVIALSVLGFASCGGGGGGKGKSEIPPERPAGTVGGVAHDGPIQNGKISAYKYTATGKGEFLVTGMTDEVGDYSLDVQSPDTPVYLEVDSGAYVEETSGLRVTLSAGQKLTALTFYESGVPLNLQLTQYTTWSQCYADYLIEKGETVGNAIVNATETFGNIAGLPIVNTRPIDITDDRNFSAFLTPGLRYGYLLAGISGLTKDLADLNNVPAHSSEQYTSIYFTQVVCSDIRFDGLMNGISAPTAGNPTGQLYIGKVALTPDHYRTMIAQNILEVADNTEINKAGIKPKELLAFANNISLNRNVIFDAFPARAVDIEGPTITPSLANDSLVSAETTIAISAVDSLGVSSVAFYLDGNFLQNGVVDDLKATIITQNFSEGRHILKIVATDTLDNESVYELPLVFVNSGANLSITSPTLTKSATYVASGSYEGGVANVKRIVIQDVEATLDTVNKTWAATITLNPGVNNVIGTIYDQFDNTATASASIKVDLIYPTVFAERTVARFTTYEGQYNLCNHGDLNDTSAESLPVCLDASKTKLNGAPITGVMTNDEFVVLAISFSDPFGSGVFTDIKDLKVEYKYERESGLVVDWALAPRQTQVGRNGVELTNGVYLPLVTEYLGANFFLTGNQEMHMVTFRVTDIAGNSTSRIFKFKLDVLTPSLQVSSAYIKNENIFTGDFGLRGGLNGANSEIAYDITNSTHAPYLVRFDAPVQHTLLHTWEVAQRFNTARVNTQEEWQGRLPSKTTWAPVTSVFNKTLNATVTPPKTLGSFASISSDIMQPPATTVWGDYIGTLVDKVVTFNRISGTMVRYGGIYEDFEMRNVYEVEYAAGYPKNEIVSKNQSYKFANNTMRLFDKSTNQEIFPVGGWFKIPPSSNVEAVNYVKFPSILNYTDLRVSANDSTVPFNAEVFLDKSLTYTLTTAMAMYRTINSGEGADVSATTDLIGNTPLIKTVKR